MKYKAIITEIIYILFMILFLYTGISKLTGYTLFREQIATSPILKPIAPFIARTLPIAEIVLAVFLLWPRFRLKAMQVATGMMILFTIYIIAILTLNKDIPCSCGGVLEEMSWTGHILFNVFFTAAGIGAILLEKKGTHPTGANQKAIPG